MVAVGGAFQRDAFAELVYRDAGLRGEECEYHIPGHEVGFVFLASPELYGKESVPAGIFEKAGDVVDLVHVVFVFVEVARKGETFSFDGFAFNGKVKGRVERVNDDVDILGVEVRLLEAVGEAFHPVFGKVPVDADDYCTLEFVCHVLFFGFRLRDDELL